MARRARFMLTEQAADFRERLLSRVVELQPFAVERIERGQAVVQRDEEAPQIAAPMWIDRGCRNKLRRDRFLRFPVFALKRRPSPALPNPVDVTLRKNRSQPRLQGTPAVKIAEQRSFSPLAIDQSEQFRKERIRQFLCVRARTAAFGDRASAGSQVTAIILNEVFP